MAALALAIVGAAACATGLTVVRETTGADVSVWQAILLIGVVCAVVSGGLALVAAQHRSATLRRLSEIS